MTPEEINKRLVEKAEASLNYLFKGAGKFRAGRFTIGNIDGDEGESLYVYLRDGRFKDASTGDRGDLLELFSLKYGSKQAGIDAAYSFLGINKPMSNNKKFTDKIIPWKKPKKDWTQLTENPAVLTYLTEKRKISLPVLEKYGVSARDDSEYAFITYTHDDPPVPCGANYIGVKRIISKDGKKKKQIVQSPNPLSTLFGHGVCKGRHDLIITEGQIDCMSYAEQGFSHVVSVPFGASNLLWIENSWDFISQFTEIYLSFDNDVAGNEAVENVAKKIGFEKCKRIILPSHYTDANEAHIDGYDLHEAFNNAAEFKPDKLVSGAELAESAVRILSQGKREEQGVPLLGWEEEESVNFRTRPREMTIWTGYPGGGKSNILYQEAAYLAFVKGESSVIASLEEDADVITGLIMIHALGIQYSKEKNVHDAFMAVGEAMRKMIFFYSFRGRAPFEEVLKTAEFVIRKHGAKHFIFDSVAKTSLNIEDNKEANEFVSLVTTSMNDTGAHYHLVAHSRKGDDQDIKEMPGLQQIKGAAAFGVECFNCITIWKNNWKQIMMANALKYRDKGGFKSKFSNKEGEQKVYTVEDVRKMPDSYLWVNKQKVGGMTGRYETFFNRENYRVSRTPDHNNEPYAKEIYDHFITNGAEEDVAF